MYYTEADLLILSRIITAETQGEPLDAQKAMAHLILNRVRANKRKFGGNTIKGVCEKIGGGPDLDDKDFEEILNWLPDVLNGISEDMTNGCEYYNNPWKNNVFDTFNLEAVVDIGHLRFYKSRSRESKCFCS